MLRLNFFNSSHKTNIFYFILLNIFCLIISLTVEGQVPYTRYNAPYFKRTSPSPSSAYYGVDSNVSRYLKFFLNEAINFEQLSFTPVDSPKKVFLVKIDSGFPSINSYVKYLIEKGRFKEADSDDLSWIRNRHNTPLFFNLKTFSLNDFETISKLKKEIQNMPPSVDKVILSYVLNERIYDLKKIDKGEFFFEVRNIAEQISDIHERSYAYEFIGEKQMGFQEYALAVNSFILAREDIENSPNLSLSQKYKEHGILCEKIADVYSTYRIKEANDKKLSYLFEALSFFISSKSEERMISAMTKLVSQPFLMDSCYYSQDIKKRNDYRKLLSATLIYLKEWIVARDKNIVKAEPIETEYFLILADICGYENQMESAKVFAVQALLSALRFNDLWMVTKSLHFIAKIYKYQRNEHLSLSYATLAYEINTNKKLYPYYYSYLYGTELNVAFGNYERSLSYVNNIINDSDLIRNLLPVYTIQVLSSAYWNKYLILEKLKSDSAYIFKDMNNSIWNDQLEYFSSIINSELHSITGWLSRSQDKEERYYQDLLRERDRNVQILKSNVSYLDSIGRLNAKQITLERNFRINDSLKFRDSLLSSRSITALTIANAKKKVENIYLISGIAGLLVCIGFILLFFRHRSLQFKRDNELNRINFLAQNNIHNLQNDYTTFSNLINEGDLDKITDYNEYYGDYLQITCANWKREKVSVAQEIEAATFYFLAKQVRSPYLKFDLQCELSTEHGRHTLFLQSIFDTVIHNSIIHGFANNDGECTIAAKIYVSERNLMCIISDNGVPPDDDSIYLANPNSGLNILKKRIENHYKTNKRKVPSEILTACSLKDKSGTVIKMILPYETI